METAPEITLVLADDHGIVLEGIASFCRARPEITVLGQCSDGEQALTLILAAQPDFAIVDLHMPKLSGLDLIRRVKLAKCPTRVIILSIERDEASIRELFRNGADGYVLKDGPASHLFDAIGLISAGKRYLTPLLRQDVLEDCAAGTMTSGEGIPPPDLISLLSKREYEVFSCLVDGMRPKDIARLLEISPKTVDTYRANIMRKLELDGIAGLVRFAIQRNIASATVPS
jgi:two-component system invasion response regulator UvrY